ncbi:MAG: hypothetical protein E7038_01505 [Lentisphaerae bacterium]|nr:hypothetical protein [Lentisphaerota bacterium]
MMKILKFFAVFLLLSICTLPTECWAARFARLWRPPIIRLPPVRPLPRPPRPQPVCSNCGQRGHYICDKCFYCKKTGHKPKDCPGFIRDYFRQLLQQLR